jgi:CheY-like chemotaxis protein
MEYWQRLALSLAIGILAALVFWSPWVAQRATDKVLLLAAGAFLVFLLPWDQIKNLKLGKLEVSLGNPEIKRALGFSAYPILLENSANSEDRRAMDYKVWANDIKEWAPVLEMVRGSRILWIDDHPSTTVNQRRLLRSIGLEVVSVASSNEGRRLVLNDNDFNLLITDFNQSQEFSWPSQHAEATTWPPGVNFVDWLHSFSPPALDASSTSEQMALESVKHLPVIFYSVMKLSDQKKAVQCIRNKGPTNVCKKPGGLVPLVCRALLHNMPRIPDLDG